MRYLGRTGFVLSALCVLVSCRASDSFVFANAEMAASTDDGWCPVSSDEANAAIGSSDAGSVWLTVDDAGVMKVYRTDGGAGTEPMTRPRLLSARRPTFTSKAYGIMRARCQITLEGTLKDCCVLKGRAGYNQAFLAVLPYWRYDPPVFRGRRVSVSYIVQLNVTP